jgi:hypothetical protein
MPLSLLQCDRFWQINVGIYREHTQLSTFLNSGKGSCICLLLFRYWRCSVAVITQDSDEHNEFVNLFILETQVRFLAVP